jgi:hypothetical protein
MKGDYLAVYSGEHVADDERECATLKEALLWAREKGCVSDWAGQSRRTPNRKGYDIIETLHEGENAIWVWILERSI